MNHSLLYCTSGCSRWLIGIIAGVHILLLIGIIAGVRDHFPKNGVFELFERKLLRYQRNDDRGSHEKK